MATNSRPATAPRIEMCVLPRRQLFGHIFNPTVMNPIISEILVSIYGSNYAASWQMIRADVFGASHEHSQPEFLGPIFGKPERLFRGENRGRGLEVFEHNIRNESIPRSSTGRQYVLAANESFLPRSSDSIRFLRRVLFGMAVAQNVIVVTAAIVIVVVRRRNGRGLLESVPKI